MAGKNGSGSSYLEEQCTALVELTSGTVNALKTDYEEITKIFAQIRGEDIIGDSTSKDELLEIIKGMDKTFEIINEKLANAAKFLDEIFEVVKTNVDQNESRTHEAGESVSATAQKATEANGSSAN